MSKAWRMAQRQIGDHCKDLGATSWILQFLVNILKAKETAAGEGPSSQFHGKSRKVTLSRMKRQKNNQEIVPTSRSGVSLLQPSVQGNKTNPQKPHTRKKKGKKEKEKKAFFRKEKQVIPGMAPHITLCIRAHWGRHLFPLLNKAIKTHSQCWLVKNSGRCKMFLNHVQFSAFGKWILFWDKKAVFP